MYSFASEDTLTLCCLSTEVLLHSLSQLLLNISIFGPSTVAIQSELEVGHFRVTLRVHCQDLQPHPSTNTGSHCTRLGVHWRASWLGESNMSFRGGSPLSSDRGQVTLFFWPPVSLPGKGGN